MPLKPLICSSNFLKNSCSSSGRTGVSMYLMRAAGSPPAMRYARTRLGIGSAIVHALGNGVNTFTELADYIHRVTDFLGVGLRVRVTETPLAVVYPPALAIVPVVNVFVSQHQLHSSTWKGTEACASSKCRARLRACSSPLTNAFSNSSPLPLSPGLASHHLISFTMRSVIGVYIRRSPRVSVAVPSAGLGEQPSPSAP